ncbi:MAG TPA: UbiX family flavin prenyltransferase [Chitinispirillaceae bacterium]|nr:UbiX family flavin prenyltransferase [Chitinispirillaceae bacterium]
MKRILVAISGASGVIMGIRLLEHLRNLAQTHLVITSTAREIISIETDFEISKVESLADHVYSNDCLSAPVASGSFPMDGMVVIPCSIKSLSSIAMSYNDNLLTRAADVMIKERRQLILCVREMPFHQGHLQLMLNLASRGVVICPPVPAFYCNPKSINDICDYFAGKVMDLLGIRHEAFKRWGDQKYTIRANQS